MKTKNKILIGVAVIVAILILTNPTMQDFKNYSGKVNGKREVNYLIFSIYSSNSYVGIIEHDELNDERFNKKYLGILKNFIKVN